MYNTSYFKEDDERVLRQFLEDYPLAFITGVDASGKQVASHIPVMVEERDGKWFLQGHIMRKTDHHKAFEKNPKVMAMFSGPNCYVSASWYTDPHMGSTWNYMTVHMHGTMRFMSDDELKSLMSKLTLAHEGGNQDSPTYFDNLTPEYHAKMLPRIAGFEIEVEQMENVFKLSQNRDEKSFRNIIQKLELQGGYPEMVANEMQRRIARLFPKENGNN